MQISARCTRRGGLKAGALLLTMINKLQTECACSTDTQLTHFEAFSKHQLQYIRAVEKLFELFHVPKWVQRYRRQYEWADRRIFNQLALAYEVGQPCTYSSPLLLLLAASSLTLWAMCVCALYGRWARPTCSVLFGGDSRRH